MIDRLSAYLSIFLNWSDYQREKREFFDEVASFTAGKETEYPLLCSWISYVTTKFRLRFDGAQRTFRVVQTGFEAHPETFWPAGETVLADIKAVMGLEVEQLPGLYRQVGSMLRKAKTVEADSFKQVFAEVYSQPVYPVAEHLPYAVGGNPVERLRFVNKHLANVEEQTAKVCDIGFGPGVVLAAILTSHPSWQGYGVDISPTCLEYAPKLLERYGVSERAELRLGDVRGLPFPDQSFDVVLASEVLEHIAEPEAGLAEMVRVLRADGRVLLGLPLRMGGGMHLAEFQSIKDIRDLCVQSGLAVEALETLSVGLEWGGSSDTMDVFVLCKGA
jgi:SAM-dependent methyltransferase